MQLDRQLKSMKICLTEGETTSEYYIYSTINVAKVVKYVQMFMLYMLQYMYDMKCNILVGHINTQCVILRIAIMHTLKSNTTTNSSRIEAVSNKYFHSCKHLRKILDETIQ